MSKPLADSLARTDALDPHCSFIVQAPAGSGKTGLLTQRFLRLLTRVEQPEELVAITFTRKAAAEMKNRILAALHGACQPPPEGDDAFLRHTWHLAEQALQRDRALGWQLLANPGRLRILTMDALAAHLTRQLPILSRLGGRFGIVEDPWVYYRQAARAALATGQANTRWSPAIAILLDHLDNHLARVESLLAGMLARRDQWLRHVGSRDEEARLLLEGVLQRVISDGLEAVDRQLSEVEKEEIWNLACYAANQLREAEQPSLLSDCHEDDLFPAPVPEEHDRWLAICELLLTRNNTWRKQVTVKNGFPPASQGRSAAQKAIFAEMKSSLVGLCAFFAERPGLQEALAGVRTLPSPAYSEAQWTILEALLHLLPMAVGQLHLAFQESGQMDFAEVALRAEGALGEPEAPTTLAMKLDYQIKHLLVDEFQDTSRGQFRLLERLTAGWNGEDGRTLFLVGDPMQSIYRFREADVGLFLRAQERGLGMIPLTPLALTVNFRSQAGLVAWVNETFPNVMPTVEESGVGAVSFHSSVPFHPPLPGSAVTVHPFCPDDPVAEAMQVVKLVQEALAAQEQVAILVRARSHLRHILPALQGAGIRHQGIDLESLAQSMVIQDLLSLTRALLYPADRIAWLAVLRAPWCGLSLADLTLLAQWQPEPAETHAPHTLWEGISSPDLINRLSTDGQARLARLRDILGEAIRQRRRSHPFPGSGSLRFWLEHLWQRLGGPATVQSRQGLADARHYFALLAATERGGELPDLPAFVERVAGLYSGVDPEADGRVVVMTIHKAKGLEFDRVILPGLGRGSRGDDKPLLSWMESASGLLLAPIKRVDQEQDDPIYAYIRALEKKKAEYEAGRLLYVAATRAKKELHLLGHLKGLGGEPASGSFLHALWPQVGSFFDGVLDALSGEGEGEKAALPLRRLPTGWQPPPAPLSLGAQAGERLAEEEPVEFLWAGELVRLVGIVVHRFLHTIALEGIAAWTAERVAARRAAFAGHLDRLGVPAERLAGAVEMVSGAVLNTVQDGRGRWILDNSLHEEAVSELALTGLLRGRLQRMVLDRTFIDREGTRWIIDFKTSLHQGGDLEGFLDNEVVRYREQVEKYGRLMQQLAAHPIKMGLYFPMHSGWREWDFG
ncbi:MAG: UvrD-helicase domain-containing protein [Magnetococcus sp. XQGC-1]